MTDTLSPEQARSNKAKLLVIILVPFALMFVAWAIFYSGVGMPTGTGNKGTLINPPLQLNDIIVDGADKIVKSDNKQWFFLMAGGSSCNEACVQRLYLTRQIRTALGKHTHKIQRLFLLDAAVQPDAEFQALLEREHADLKVQAISREAFDALLAGHATAATTSSEQGYYLADFRGFIPLYYGAEHTYKDTMKDIKFLLKYAP